MTEHFLALSEWDLSICLMHWPGRHAQQRACRDATLRSHLSIKTYHALDSAIYLDLPMERYQDRFRGVSPETLRQWNDGATRFEVVIRNSESCMLGIDGGDGCLVRRFWDAKQANSHNHPTAQRRRPPRSFSMLATRSSNSRFFCSNSLIACSSARNSSSVIVAAPR